MFTCEAAPLNLSPLPSPSSLLPQPLLPSLGPQLPLSLPDPHAWALLDLGHLSPSRAHIPEHPAGWHCHRSACGVLSVQGG